MSCKITNENAGLLTNIEVFELLNTQIGERKGKKHDKNAPNTLRFAEETENQVFKFLKDERRARNSEQVAKLIEVLNAEGFDLTQAEAIGLFNHRPTTMVEIHLIVEECPERYSDEQVGKLLDLIQEYLQPNEPMEE